MERHRKATIVRYHATIVIPKDLIATIGAGPVFRVVLTAVVAASLLGLALSSFFLRLPRRLAIDPMWIAVLSGEVWNPQLKRTNESASKDESLEGPLFIKVSRNAHNQNILGEGAAPPQAAAPAEVPQADLEPSESEGESSSSLEKTNGKEERGRVLLDVMSSRKPSSCSTVSNCAANGRIVVV